MNHPTEAAARSIVVLTGASSGIGHATALALAARGARIALAARGIEALEAVAAECRQLGAEVIAVPTDVSDSAAVQALGQAAMDRFGHIDVWINNVGIGVVGLFDQTPIELHRRVIETNLIGHMNGAHVALAHFRQRRKGTLINMLSVAGIVAAPYAAAYVASKFALRGFSESVRAEMSGFADVHVCDIYPTFVDTPAMSHAGNYTGRNLAPPPPLLDPREVAARAVALIDRPRATVLVGSVALPAKIAHAVAPELVGRVAMWVMERALDNANRALVTAGSLFQPSIGTTIDGGHRSSKPATGLMIGGALAATAIGLGWRALRRR